MNSHEFFIRRCFELAKKGIGYVSPNPLVGCVIVKGDRIIGEGYHERFGSHHAEVNAINSSKESLEGSTLYCNLEPCCHSNKKTPPCLDLIIEKRISKVVISNLDPNPEVSGRSVKKLRELGVEVISDVLKDEGEDLNEVFFYFIQNKKPFIHIKLAQSLDGKIATLSGDSKWISDKDARKYSHFLRSKYDSILVGRKTAELDNPKLNVRMGSESLEDPWKIILGDSENFLKKFDLMFNERTIYIDIKNKFIKIKDKKLDCKSLEEALSILGDQGISSMFIEGGGELISSFIEKNLFNKMTFFIAPILIGEGKGYYNKKINKIIESKKLRTKDIKIINNQAVFEVLN